MASAGMLFNDAVNCEVYIPSEMSTEQWRMVLTGETEVLGEKTVTVTLCPAQISHGLT